METISMYKTFDDSLDFVQNTLPNLQTPKGMKFYGQRNKFKKNRRGFYIDSVKRNNKDKRVLSPADIKNSKKY